MKIVNKQSFILLVVFQLLFVHVSFSHSFFSSTDSIGIKEKNGKQYILYLVNAGETIYSISTRFQVPISTLMEDNPELEDGLKTGQVIQIQYKPVEIKEQEKVEKSEKAETVYHVVKHGETLYSLSRKYGVSVNQLLKWNGLEIVEGQKLVVAHPNSNDVVVQKPKSTEKQESVVTQEQNSSNELIIESVLGPKTLNRILVIPFDPYLYFSDADDEIALESKIHRTKVRYKFRARLNALLMPRGYETIHLLGGMFKDSIGTLNKIYKSVTYNYQEILVSGRSNEDDLKIEEKSKTKNLLDKLQKDNVSPASSNRTFKSEDDHRYFGVKIKDPAFFDHFNTKYDLDYYIFINQFEVKTNYEHCLDRATQNYERSFLVHYSIFDKEGKILVGNKARIFYNSNNNNIEIIIRDNMYKVANEIMSHLPNPTLEK